MVVMVCAQSSHTTNSLVEAANVALGPRTARLSTPLVALGAGQGRRASSSTAALLGVCGRSTKPAIGDH